MAVVPARIRFIRAPLLLALVGISLLTPRAEITAAPPATAEPISSGLSVVIPATDARDLIARSREGRVLVHALATDAAVADRLRTEIAAGKANGLVTIQVWNGFPALPYAEDLVDDLTIDADALGGRGPSPAEIDRVLVPQFGKARIRAGGVWTERVRPMPASFGEWTHYFNDSTNNPVGKDQAGIPTGLRWIAGSQVSGSGYELVGGGRYLHVGTEERSNFSGYGGISRWSMRVRNAFNGLPVWDQTAGDWKRTSWQRYEAAIIDGDRLIQLRGADGPLIARSLIDGKELMAYDQIPIQRPERFLKIPATTSDRAGAAGMAVLEGRTLYVASGNVLTAVDADRGTLRWRFNAPAGSVLAFPCIDRRTKSVMVAIGPIGIGSGRMTHFTATELRGFDAGTGAQRWAIPNPLPDHIASMSTLDGGLYIATATHLASDDISIAAFDAATGAPRWKQLATKNAASGTLMLYPGRAFIGRSRLIAYNLATGAVVGNIATGNARCDVPRGSATTISNFGQFFNVTDPNRVAWNRREIVRNSCGGAAIPAYGLRYATDNRCSCFEAVRGEVAIGHQPLPPPSPDGARLLKGPAAARPLGKEAVGWTAFLGDDRRSGAGGALKSGKPTKRWQVRVATTPTAGLLAEEWRRGDAWNGPITPPTVADGRVYVAETVGQRLVCLDAKNGGELWSFRTAGRIDGPPRLVRGRAVFGCADGYVYCLDAADGALVWRFQAAPSLRLISTYAQLASAWPVPGAVPVENDTVIASAGWHPEADGGIALWGLDLSSGSVKWKRTVTKPRPELSLTMDGSAQKPDLKAIFDANRVVNTLLVADQTVFHLMGLRMRVADGTDQPEHPEFALMPRWGSLAPPQRRPSQLNLTGPGGWGAQWGLMDHKLRKWKDGKADGKPGINGRPICTTSNYIVIQGYQTANGGCDALVCYPRSAAADNGAPLWSVSPKELLQGAGLSVAPSSMIIAGDRIVSAGAAYDPKAWLPTSSPLEIRSITDGKILHNEVLPTPVVDHGLATADGRLYLSLEDGSVVCME
jgi:outer membrane protein assembly factor BamB